MRVLLVYNSSAGTEEHRQEEIVRGLCRAGHDVAVCPKGEVGRSLPSHRDADLLVVAGGDGTVRKVALASLGSGIPVGILPIGTANNLARSLGLDRPVGEILGSLESFGPRGFDVGVASGPWGDRLFLEGFGAGLFSDYLALLKTPENHKWAEALRDDQGLVRDYVFLPQLLSGYSARGWELCVDGAAVVGDYFLVEALNTTSIGPFSDLSAAADPGDGCLDLVTLGEAEIGAFREVLEARAAGVERPFSFEVRRCRELTLRCRDEYLHFDDSLWPGDDKHAQPSPIHVTVRPSALTFWGPPK